jgi:multiple sugar transport system permease protein
MTPFWRFARQLLLFRGTLIAALPIILLFAVLGRRVVNSIGFSAGK